LFSKADCIFFGLQTITNTIKDMRDDKEKAKEQYAENALDVLRIISLADDLAEMDFLVAEVDGKKVEADDEDSDSDENDDNSDDEQANDKPAAKSGQKRHIDKSLSKQVSKKTKLSSESKIMSLNEHKKRFSKAWIVLLSLQFTPSQHKIILKHLSDHVIMHLTKPLLIADYLSRSYEAGGIVSVLALESLFHLILQHNLDYPNFFNSLFKLCKKEVFEAKYRSKFMKLLSQSLQSSNLPAYIVAAFIKRLARLCLVVPTPAGYYCIGQVIWLLRKHPQCQVLIHRVKPDTSSSDVYDAVTDDFEKTQALQSSLWEALMIQQHHVRGIAILAKALESVASTSVGADGMYLNVNDMIDRSYATMIEEELKGIKNRSELAYQAPAALIPPTSCVSSIFG
jgi:U3 small nucleolar RNA-associated protein 19